MPTYIKTGFWEKLQKGHKGYLNLDNLISVKKVYTAYITQTSDNAPVATILKNELSTVTWNYISTGIYTLTKTGAFIADKTVPDKTEVYIDIDGNKLTLERTDVNTMTLKTYAAADTDTLADDVLSGQYVNIEIYK